MKNIFDYIKSQEKSFSEKPFTNADAAVFSTLANLDFSYFYEKIGKKNVPLNELCANFLNICRENDRSPEVLLLEAVKDSPRYGPVLVQDVVSEIDKNCEKQFGALIFNFAEDWAYIGFAGTGTSVVGYKEDLNMAYMDMVPSQQDSVVYLNSFKEDFPENLIVGGFSKGGNLAVFASAFCAPEVREKIKKVFNHDGPGFSKLILKEDKYKSILPLVQTYIPKASIVGLMLEHNNDYTVIDSTAPPIAQHQPYSWIFEGDDLKEHEKLSRASRFMLSMEKNLLASASVDERRDCVNAIFDLIVAVEPDDFLNFLNKDLKKAFRASWKEANKETRKDVRKFVKFVGKAFVDTIKPIKRKKK